MKRELMENIPPDELIELALQGSQAACEALYNQHLQAIYRLAYGVLLNQQDAEEVVQDSFAYAFRTLHRFDSSRSAFRTWLYTITLSRCRNKRRRKWLPSVQFSELAEAIPGQGNLPEQLSERFGIRDIVYQALAKLSPKLREAVVLRYFDGLTYREMSEVLDCPLKTAESRVRLAHDALYRILADDRDALRDFGFSYE